MSVGLGGADSSALRLSRSRGRTGSSADYGLQYPSPFFDIGQTYLPATVKQMFRWCRYYFLVNPLINAVVAKMADYPVTDIILDTDKPDLKDKWYTFLNSQLRYRPFQIELGLDYYAYGNALVSIFYPFVKMLKCKRCGHEKQAADATYRFMNFEFHWECTKCSHADIALVRDHYIKAPKGIRLLRWNPEDIDTRYNDITGESEYYYTIPVQIKNDIIMGKKSTVETMPQLFIDALRLRKAVVFSRDNIYHFKRPTLAGKDRGWGTPMILPVLKDTFYLQVLRKAQESIALEHIVPLRVLFPQAGSATSDPYCVALDSLVETREGVKPAGEVKTGDWLKTHTGAWKPVEAAVDRSIRTGEKVYEFSIASLSAFPFEVSEDHPLLAVKRPSGFRGYESLTEEPDFIEAKDVNEGDFVCYPHHRTTWESLDLDLHEYCPERAFTEEYLYRRLDQQSADIYEYLETNGVPNFDHGERRIFLSEKGWSEDSYNNAKTALTQQESVDRICRYLPVTKDLAYVIGMYAAEGSQKDTGVSFSLNSAEDQLMHNLDSALQKIGFACGHRHTRGNSTEYTVGDVFLGSLLPQLCGRGAQNKRLPRFIVEAPEDIALSAVEAVFLGDGCSINSETRREGLKTVSPQLTIDVRAVLLSFGLISTVQKSIPGEHELAKLPYYQVNLNGAQGDVFVDLCLGGDKYKRKGFSRCGFIRGGYVYLRVNKRTESPDVKVVRGFQIKGDKSFCVVGVATHNTSVNLMDWHDQIAGELRRWRADNNYIPILPLPIGQQTIGGDGRALLLSQEIRVWSEHIIAGMGVPTELIFGGLSYSGSNVSLRMLENMFLGYLSDQLALLRWVIERTSSYLGWAKVGARFKPFKMADDLQRKAYLFQLNQAGKISDESLCSDADYDSAKEDKIMENEATRRIGAMKKQRLLQAEMEGEAQLAQQKWVNKAQAKAMKDQVAIQGEGAKDQMAFQAEMQNGMMQDQAAAQTGQAPPPKSPDMTPTPRNPDLIAGPKEINSPLSLQSVQRHPPSATNEDIAGGANVDILYMARRLADKFSRLNPGEKPVMLGRLKQFNPALHDTVMGLMMSGGNGPTAAAQASARALPMQRAPRRGPEAAQL